MNLNFRRRDRRNQEMDSSLTSSLLLLSVLFMQFVSAADQNNVTIEATVGDNVILPCKDPDQGEIRLAEWNRTALGPQNVLLYRNLQIDPAKQHQSYRDRVDLLINQINKGDVSLLLKETTTDDSGTYECRVLQTNLEKKLISTVRLQVSPPPEPFPVWVKALFVLLVLPVLLVLALVAAAGVFFYFWRRWKPVQQVVEESGVESVLLPLKVPRFLWFCIFRLFLQVDKVEWRNRDKRKVHVNQNGSDQPEEQDEFYRTRTRMDKNLLKTGDFSLTLRWPTGGDTGFYTCKVYNRIGVVLMEKQVHLWVKVQKVEVESGEESVLLPCRTTESLDGDIRVEWRDGYNSIVHVYQNGSDQPGEQNQIYRTRTKMDENLLKNKDLSLTLRRSRETDSGFYTCRVYNRKGDVLMMKQVQLEVKVQQVEVESGVESVLLPCRTTESLDGDVRVEWMDGYNRIVHVYQNGSDQPEEQDQDYRTRTKMDENLLKNKDLSLTLRLPTYGDRWFYTCRVYNSKGVVLMEKQVYLQVKAGTVQVQPEDTGKPLMADQSV